MKQKRKRFAQEKNQVINENVDRLMANKMIQEVHYPEWLANIIVVKKKEWDKSNMFGFYRYEKLLSER